MPSKTSFAGGGQGGNWQNTRANSTPSVGGGGITASWTSSDSDHHLPAILPVENSGSGGAGGSNNTTVNGSNSDICQHGTNGAAGIVIVRFQ